MTLTSHGPRCDVCGDYILLKPINSFSIFGTSGLHCDDACKARVLALDTSKDKFWRDLPEGPVRELAERISELPESDETGGDEC